MTFSAMALEEEKYVGRKRLCVHVHWLGMLHRSRFSLPGTVNVQGYLWLSLLLRLS